LAAAADEDGKDAPAAGTAAQPMCELLCFCPAISQSSIIATFRPPPFAQRTSRKQIPSPSHSQVPSPLHINFGGPIPKILLFFHKLGIRLFDSAYMYVYLSAKGSDILKCLKENKHGMFKGNCKRNVKKPSRASKMQVVGWGNANAGTLAKQPATECPIHWWLAGLID
jgi:hypothetical protein